jgi:hypothetical protein
MFPTNPTDLHRFFRLKKMKHLSCADEILLSFLKIFDFLLKCAFMQTKG